MTNVVPLHARTEAGPAAPEPTAAEPETAPSVPVIDADEIDANPDEFWRRREGLWTAPRRWALGTAKGGLLYAPIGLYRWAGDLIEFATDRNLGRAIRDESRAGSPDVDALQKRQAYHRQVQWQNLKIVLLAFLGSVAGLLAAFLLVTSGAISPTLTVTAFGMLWMWAWFSAARRGCPPNKQIVEQVIHASGDTGRLHPNDLRDMIVTALGPKFKPSQHEIVVTGPKVQPDSDEYLVHLKGVTDDQLAATKRTLAGLTGWKLNRIRLASNQQWPGYVWVRHLNYDPDGIEIDQPDSPLLDLADSCDLARNLYDDGLLVGWKYDPGSRETVDVRIPFGWSHILVIGESQMGKSTMIKGMVADARLTPSTVVHVADLKTEGSVDYRQLGPGLDTWIKGYGDDAADELNALLDETIDLINTRGLWVADVLDSDPGLVPNERPGALTACHPDLGNRLGPVLLVIEEYSSINYWPKSVADETWKKIGVIARKGLGLGIGLLLSTQDPSAKDLPPTVRKNTKTRVSFYVEDIHTVNQVLGTYRPKVNPMTLSPFEAAVRAHEEWHRVSTFYHEPAELDRIASAAEQMRLTWGYQPLGPDGSPLGGSRRFSGETRVEAPPVQPVDMGSFQGDEPLVQSREAAGEMGFASAALHAVEAAGVSAPVVSWNRVAELMGDGVSASDVSRRLGVRGLGLKRHSRTPTRSDSGSGGVRVSELRALVEGLSK